MVAFTLAVTGLACSIVGLIIACTFSKKRFWDRQNFMEKINRRF